MFGRTILRAPLRPRSSLQLHQTGNPLASASPASPVRSRLPGAAWAGVPTREEARLAAECAASGRSAQGEAASRLRCAGRGEVSALVDTASNQGTLRGDESRVLSNMRRFEELLVEQVMTPRIVVAMMPANATAKDLLEAPDVASYSRIPLYQGERDTVTGYVLHREVLAALARGESDAPLSRFARPLLSVSESMTLGAALRGFLGHHEHVAMVIDEHGTISGLVTLEDVIETILGREIVDEDDRVADLRVLAAQARDRRLARMHASRAPAERGPGEG